MGIQSQNENRDQKRSKRHGSKGSTFWALLLIAAGIILIVENLHLVKGQFNWWALFIFLPAFGSISSAWDEIRDKGSFTAKAGGSLGSAAVVGTVAVLLLFGMDWSRWWPLIVLAFGFSLFLAGIGRLETAGVSNLSPFARLGAWIGLGGMVLGAGFLAQFLPIPALQPVLAGTRWWAVPILIAGVGALVNVISIFWQNERRMNWAAWSMLLIAVFILAIGLLAWLALDMNLLLPIVLIACGLVILVGFFNR